MKPFRRRLPSITLIVALGAMPPSFVGAEDIDLFAGSGGPTTNPNILIIIDNSANWAAANQHWPGGVKQGQSELRSLKTVVGEATVSLNLGLMLLTAGTGAGNKDGAYVRYAIQQMTAGNKAALQELIGDGTCINGANSLNGTPNCIFNNFSSGTLNESVGTNVDYSATLFEAFKYFGGFTSPAHAHDDVAGTPVDASHFGPLRYSGNPDSRSDPAAFLPSTQRTTYKPPISSLNSCAKNYVIFIGNGFPTQDSPGSLLSGVGGSTTQLPMPQFKTTTTVQTPTIGTACGTGTSNTLRITNCTANIPQSLKDANPADSYACVGTGVVDAVCPGINNQKFNVQASKTVITVTPTGVSAVPSTSTARFADEWAKFLFTTDVNAAAGQQNVVTYTIDVFKDQQSPDETALLMSMAKFGGGRYFQATSEDAILKALREILVEIQAVNSVFASASLPINATNRSQNENQVFIGMFRPDANGRPRWYGNLKRYQFALFGADAKLADVNGAEAVSAATGFVQSCATSFWTTDTTKFDTAGNDISYWAFSPISAGQCTTPGRSVLSDSPDGPLVEKGATAEVVRKGNDPAAASPTFAENRTIYTCSSTSTCTSLVVFNTANVSQLALGAADATEQQKIVDFGRGKDVNDENANAVTTAEVRPSVHGDVAHSRPLPANYGGSTGVVIYYGANDGTFRAISGTSGKELWAFIAPEHHGKLKRLTNNSPKIQYPGIPPDVPLQQPKDYFFDGSVGLFQNADNSTVWVFPTMRRGGRMLYAFDVTTPTTPVLKWRQGCPNLTNDTDCSTGFDGIGQTWSFPNVAKIKSFSNTAPVIIVGGGYDACEDADTSAPSCGGAKGRKVYVINADTGALIRSFATERSVVADVTLVDRDFDGFVDHAYVADTGGNLYRIDFVNPTTLTPLAATTDWTITRIARTNVTAAGRKFQFAPAALVGSHKVYLALGSGDRERPLISNYPFGATAATAVMNRFYMFIDSFDTSEVNLDGALLTDFSTGTVDFPTSSSCEGSLATTAKGWRFDLNTGRGEQTVTSAVIFGGLIFFSTNRPISTPPGACSANLGEARGYAVNLLTASGAVDTGNLCGGVRSGIFTGGGLPPSPVVGVVPIGGKQVTVMIGGIQREGGASSPIGGQKVKPTINPRRSRVYWYTK